MSPLSIACRHQRRDLSNCGAGAGEPCNWTAPGFEFDGFFHIERFADALGWLKPGEPPSGAAIMDAVERTGLV